MIIIDLELKNHGYKVSTFLECGCFVREVKDENNLSLVVCQEHRKELNKAIKQSIITNS